MYDNVKSMFLLGWVVLFCRTSSTFSYFQLISKYGFILSVLYQSERFTCKPWETAELSNSFFPSTNTWSSRTGCNRSDFAPTDFNVKIRTKETLCHLYLQLFFWIFIRKIWSPWSSVYTTYIQRHTYSSGLCQIQAQIPSRPRYKLFLYTSKDTDTEKNINKSACANSILLHSGGTFRNYLQIHMFIRNSLLREQNKFKEHCVANWLRIYPTYSLWNMLKCLLTY